MKKLYLFACIAFCCITQMIHAQGFDSTSILFNIDTVAKNLGYPWEITYGSDDSLWITEARGYRVLRMSASLTQAQKNLPTQQILKIPLGSSLVNFSRSIGTWPQGGMQRPLFVTFNWGASAIPADGSNNFTWPTIAPSGIDFYNGNIPGWKNSLLISSLKLGLYRLKLKSTGDYVDSSSSSNTVDTFPLLHGWRVRDLAIHPLGNSGKFWVIIDSTGNTSGPTGGFSSGTVTATKDGGKVLLLTYKSLITLPFGTNPLVHPPVVNDLVRIWPNPAVTALYIQGRKNLRKPVLAQVCDVSGKMLKEVTSYHDNFNISLSGLHPGMYILKLYNGYEMELQIEKFIKQ